MSYEVSAYRCSSYEEREVRAAIEKCLGPYGGLQAFVRKDDRVLLKPNLLLAKRPEQAVTTHPVVVKALVRMVQELGGTPAIGDSPGGPGSSAYYRSVLRSTGMQAVADETGCAIASFGDEGADVSSPASRTFRQLKVAQAVLDADKVIALPKLKTHQLTYYTGAVKLLFGYVPGLQKMEYHHNAGRDLDLFSELLLDLHNARAPDLAVMDAVVGMEGRGPSAGDPRQVGLLMASRSCTALDYVAATVVGFEPLEIPTIRKALERGEGPGGMGEIAVHGESLAAVRVPGFRKPDTLGGAGLARRFTHALGGMRASRPQIDRKRCRKCGVCAEGCPPHAMVFNKGSVPAIDYNKCIRCYCCQELCPEAAVGVQKPLLRRVLR